MVGELLTRPENTAQIEADAELFRRFVARQHKVLEELWRLVERTTYQEHVQTHPAFGSVERRMDQTDGRAGFDARWRKITVTPTVITRRFWSPITQDYSRGDDSPRQFLQVFVTEKEEFRTIERTETVADVADPVAQKGVESFGVVTLRQDGKAPDKLYESHHPFINQQILERQPDTTLARMGSQIAPQEAILAEIARLTNISY